MKGFSGAEDLRVFLVSFVVALVLAGVLPSPSALAQTLENRVEDLEAHDEVLRSRQEVLTSDVSDFKAEVAAATATLRAEMASEDAAVRAELATEVSGLRAEMVTAVSMAAPPGTIVAYFGTIAPAGWLVCDGTPIPQGEQYNALRALVGPNTPDLRGRVILMADPSGAVLASASPPFCETGGEEKHVLAADEMPAHNHSFQVNTEGFPDGGYDTSGSYKYWNTWRPERSNIYTTTGGGNVPHNNMQPYFALNWIIKY